MIAKFFPPCRMGGTGVSHACHVGVSAPAAAAARGPALKIQIKASVESLPGAVVGNTCGLQEHSKVHWKSALSWMFVCMYRYKCIYMYVCMYTQRCIYAYICI